GVVGGAEQRCQVLAAGADGAEESRGAGYSDCLRGRAKGISGSHRSGVSANGSAVVHCASGAGVAELRTLEGTKRDGRGSQDYLSRGDGRRSGTATGRAGSEMERVSQRKTGVAAELGADRARFPVVGGGA